MALSLDGNTSFIGTEFIKLLNTGSSDLATVEYVDEQVALGGGGGGNVDLSNYYTQTEVDTLLNNKLNVNNPQDITGTLRIDSTNGNGKLIVNAVGAPNDEDFYVNGLSNLGGTLKAQVIQASSNIQTSQQIQSNTINTYSNSNLIIQRNAIPYITLDSQIVDDETVEKIILMKDVEFSGGLSLNTLSVDTLNTIGLNDMVFNVATLGEFLRFQVSDNTVRVPNNRSFLSQNIYTDIIRPIAFGNDLICYGSNAADTGYIEYWKLNHAAETIDISRVVRVNEINTLTNTDLIIKRYGVQRLSITSTYTEFTGAVHCGNQLVVDTAKKLTLAPYAFGGINHFDIRNNHTANPMIRFRCGLTGEITCMELTTSYVNLKKDLTIENTVKLKTNTIDTNDDNNLVFNRNNVEYFRLTTDGSVDSVDFVKVLRANGQIRVNNLQINQFSSGVQYADFRLENADSIVRFFVGNGTSANFQITNVGISLSRETTISSVKTNTIDTNGDNGLTIRRNGTDVLNIFTYTPTNGPTIIVDAQTDCGISSSWMFANVFANRTGNTDTEFRGAISGGLSSGKVYMTYLHATETLDFDCSIDNTGRSVIGNILDTTVSDERLKTDIEDVDTDFTSCIKHVKVKTFKYKDDKYKTNDSYGFIAQELQKHLPKECKNIVKENKVKNEDETFLSINYMKLSVVLWGALQETLSKVEHLEASVYELQEELKDNKKSKAKAKAKSKS